MIWAIVPAAGGGQRLPGEVPKQYRQIAGQSLLDHCLQRLLAEPRIDAVMVGLAAQDKHWPASRFAADRRVHHCVGGAQRADTVLACLQSLNPAPAAELAVLVHDAARALLPAAALRRLLDCAAEPAGALLAIPAQDTVKHSVDGQRVDGSRDRARLWLAQTPQLFPFGVLRRALEQARRQQLAITDEASAVEAIGLAPRLVLGDALNFKITTASDLRLAQAVLESGCE